MLIKMVIYRFSYNSINSDCGIWGSDDIAFETISSLNMDPGLNGKYIGIAKRDDIEFEHHHFNPKGSYKDEKQSKTVDHIKNLIDSNTKAMLIFLYNTNK